jgi:hypothetical protein
VQEIIYSVFQWDEGAFDFQEGELPSREVIVLRMSTADLIMEGVRRVERWTRIQRAVGGLGQQYRLAADTASTMGDMSLQKDEMDLIATIDGVMSLEEICAARRQSDFKACRTVWGSGPRACSTAFPRTRLPGAATRRSLTPSACAGPPSGARSKGSTSCTGSSSSSSATSCARGPPISSSARSRRPAEEATLFEGVSVDGAGELDSFALRRNIVSGEIARYLAGLDRLLAIEADLARELLGERKAAIINDGLLALKERQLQRAARPS